MKNDGMNLYNLFPLMYGEIKNWYEPVRKAAWMGFNTVFINPVFESGFSGSIYSIKDYFKIDPRFAGSASGRAAWGALRKFLDFAHRKKLKVVMDIVINHTAVDSPLVKKHPRWYRMKNGKVMHPGAFDGGRWIEWGDLAWIDNRNSKDRKNLYEYWWKVLEFYLDAGFDGFRADAAYQVPAELWRTLIRKARRKR